MKSKCLKCIHTTEHFLLFEYFRTSTENVMVFNSQIVKKYEVKSIPHLENVLNGGVLFSPPLKLVSVLDRYISVKYLTLVVVPQRKEIQTTTGNS